MKIMQTEIIHDCISFHWLVFMYKDCYFKSHIIKNHDFQYEIALHICISIIVQYPYSTEHTGIKCILTKCCYVHQALTNHSSSMSLNINMQIYHIVHRLLVYCYYTIVSIHRESLLFTDLCTTLNRS